MTMTLLGNPRQQASSGRTLVHRGAVERTAARSLRPTNAPAAVPMSAPAPGAPLAGIPATLRCLAAAGEDLEALAAYTTELALDLKAREAAQDAPRVTPTALRPHRSVARPQAAAQGA
jgi:hypothetical protein